MINQQINLYHDRFHQKRQYLTAVQTALMVLVVVIVMASYGVHLKLEMNRVTSENLALKQQQKDIAENLAQANAELKRLLADTRFDEQISEVSREIRARIKVIEFVDADRPGSNQGFSSYLVSLSNLHIDNLWLNEIKLAHNFLRIQGSSLSEELVPAYFDQFSHDGAFAGNRFELFRLQRDEATAWKVDFEIASEEPLDG